MSDPSTPAAPPRGRPPRIDRARTVDTALRLLDAHGLDALTMRRLAEAEGVRAGALYRHFATKHALLTAMAERMVAEVTPAARPPEAGSEPAAAPDQGGQDDWAARLVRLARGLRTALLAHRDGARVYAGTHATGAGTLAFAEAVTGTLREAGFGAADAARALLTLVNFTVGHTLEEQAAAPPPGAEEPAEPADPDRLRDAVHAPEHPHLAAVLPTLTSTDFTAHFEFGLRLLIEGLRTLDRAGR